MINDLAFVQDKMCKLEFFESRGCGQSQAWERKNVHESVKIDT